MTRVPRAAIAALLSAGLLVALPATTVGHSELVRSTPADGDVLAVAPTEIIGRFSEPVDPDRSSMELRGPDGSRVARGGVPDGGPLTSMAITGLPPLSPGRYEVRWTTRTPDDGGIERGRFSFTVAEPTPAPPTATPAPTSTATPVATPSPSPTATPTATPAAASPTVAPGPDPGPTAGVVDVLIPLGVLVLVLAGGAAWLVVRRRR